ncbi:MAG: hypothetical protein WC314_12145 [Vulcanimicrobiota bacterium]
MAGPSFLGRIKEYIASKLQGALGFSRHLQLSSHQIQLLELQRAIAVSDFRSRNLFANPRYQDPRRLSLSEFSVFSQNGEDGIIQEIFRRIGTTNREFVEFGVWKSGNNTINLLLPDWSGLWLEENEDSLSGIRKDYGRELKSGQLRLQSAHITAENILDLFKKNKVTSQFDLLSIDVDGNDYWLWESVCSVYQPRVVVIEYNAKFLPQDEWVMEYNPDHVWDQTSYSGASLKALELLGRKLSYTLVGCDFTGNNAFFVKNELVGEETFYPPFISETHYEAPKHFLVMESGHPSRFGPYVQPLGAGREGL